MPGTRKLGRTTDHRISMLRGMVTYLFENGRIETTVTRAKEVRAMAEKMITMLRTTHFTRSTKSWHTSPKKMLQRSSLRISPPNIRTLTAVIPA